MSWLTLNGIETSGIASIEGAPTGEHRNIGADHEATDGSLTLTRQTRKRDLQLQTVPLSGADAFAWESLLVCEGHVWSFDSHFYSSKGLAGVASGATLESATPSPRYGAKYMEVPLDQTFTATFPAYAKWTVACWFRNGDGAFSTEWHHLVTNSDGHTWLDGVSNDGFGFDGDSFLFSFDGTTLTITGPDPGPAYIDDLIVCPYLWLEDWPAQVYADTKPFGPTPYLTAAGLLVPEAATRDMACMKCDERVMKANLSDGNGMAPDVRVLSVELKAR